MGGRQSKRFLDRSIAERTDLRGAQTKPHRLQIDVLSDVSGLGMDIALSARAVVGFGASVVCGDDQHYGSRGNPILMECGSRYFLAKVARAQ